MKANNEIREALKKNGIPFWKLGEELGVSEQTILRWMRTPLCDLKLEAVTGAIGRICEGRHE